MKIQTRRKPFIDNKRGPTSFSVKMSQLEQLRQLSKWLLILPAAMLLLFGFGQLGILASQKLAESNTSLPGGVDYGPWAYILIHSSLFENPEPTLHGRILGVAPSGNDEDDAPTVFVSPPPTDVVSGVPIATKTLPPLSSTPSPTSAPENHSEFTSTPTMGSSPLATSSPTQPAATTSIPEPYKFCDADGNPLSYDQLHYHVPDVKSDGFGTIIHALRIDEEETQVILEKVTVKQNQSNPNIFEVVSVDWSHWGMGSTKIDVQELKNEVTITPNLEFYACFAEGKCDHSLYGGEIYVDFDGELSGEYHLFMDVYFPEHDELCKLDLLINVNP